MMINALVSWVVSALIVMVADYLIPGVHVDDFITALAVALVLGIVNALIKPAILLLTLPVTMITFGLFVFVINALLVLLVSAVVPGFKVDNFWWALAFSLVVSFFRTFLHHTSRI